MKDHEKRELVNRLTKLAQEFAETQQLRARIAGEALPALDTAVAAERERWPKLCKERAQLSWAAADQPHAPEVKMQHEAVAAAMEELARELRA